MTLMLLCLVPAVLLAWFTRRHKFRGLRKLTRTPLAGYDTGVRSAWRTPGRLHRPHRGF